MEGDTPEDTLRTLIGRLNDVRDRQKTLDKQNADLVKENERLRRRNQDVSGQVNEAVNGLREQYDKRQAQLQNEQLSLTAKIRELTDKLKNPETEKKRRTAISRWGWARTAWAAAPAGRRLRAATA